MARARSETATDRWIRHAVPRPGPVCITGGRYSKRPDVQQSCHVTVSAELWRIQESTTASQLSQAGQYQQKLVTKEESHDNRSTSWPMGHMQHDLDVWKMCLGKRVDDRRLFLKEDRICFGCYGNDHVSKGCTKKRTCQKCGKRHTAALHIDCFSLQRFASTTSVTTPDVTANNPASGSRNKSADTSNTSCTATLHSNAEKIFHGIPPVTIRQKGSDHVISSYSFYDNGNSICHFLRENGMAQWSVYHLTCHQKDQPSGFCPALIYRDEICLKAECISTGLYYMITFP